MTIMNEGASPSDGLVARVKNILLSPKTEWPRIAAEPTTIQELYTRYVCILAAIPAVAGLIGALLIAGMLSTFLAIHYPPGYWIANAVGTYLLSLVGVAVTALAIEFLAPSFGAEKDRIAAFKVAAYSYTPGWIAGILLIIPPLGIVAALVALYGFYLLYLGLQSVMKAPQDKAIGYTVVTVIVAVIFQIIVMYLLKLILFPIFGMSMIGASMYGLS